jgi:S1-C subfamily serine protease
MNFMKKLASKNLFVFNLVLIGVVFGFSLAFLSFSCSSPQTRAQAQEAATVTVPQDSLAVAESLQNAFRAVADKVTPSVMEVQTVSVTTMSNNFSGTPWEYFFGPQGKGGDQEYETEGLGSGIIVRKDGNTYYVLTNYHVIEDVTEVTLVSSSGDEYSAEIVGSDSRKDLALLSFETTDAYPVAVLGDSDTVKVGDFAIAVGNPLGYMFSVTQGIVSAVGRTGGPAGNINDFIQTDAAINQGNSGGPLVNIKGEVIGINTWIASNGSSAGNLGLGFAIPINNAKSTIDDLIEDGTIQSGWLGVSLTDPGRDDLAALGLTGKKGALAINVFIDSPAYKAGIRPGDFITALNGKEMNGMNALPWPLVTCEPALRQTSTLFGMALPKRYPSPLKPGTKRPPPIPVSSGRGCIPPRSPMLTAAS